MGKNFFGDDMGKVAAMLGLQCEGSEPGSYRFGANVKSRRRIVVVDEQVRCYGNSSNKGGK